VRKYWCNLDLHAVVYKETAFNDEQIIYMVSTIIKFTQIAGANYT
jgi:hypothetical protein